MGLRSPLSIRQMMLVMSMTAILGVVMVGGIGLMTGHDLSRQSANILDSSAALAANGEADMMHDALRADVLAALLAGRNSGSQANMGSPINDLAEHAATFEAALQTLGQLPLHDDARQRLDRTHPVVKSYIATGRELALLASTQPDASQAKLAEFTAAYRILETEMEALGEVIEARAQAEQDRAEAISSRSVWLILAATALGAAVLTAMAAWSSRVIIAPVQAAMASAERVAQGELGHQIAPYGPVETRRLLSALNTMSGELARLIGTLSQDAQGVATASTEIAQGSQDLSQRTERQAAALQQAAATMSDLGTTVEQNAEQTAQAHRLVSSVNEVAGQGESMVRQVVDTMQGINGSAQHMAEIVSLIDGIAFQTNILALNAAVEAARAGEQGRGFAVVANEVRSLATRSAKAAQEIKLLITASVEQVNGGSTLVSETGRSMQQLVGSVQAVGHLVADLNVANQRQASSIREIVSVVSEMDSMTQQNSALVEQSAAAAACLRDQAQRMFSAVSAFRVVHGGASGAAAGA